MTTERTKTEFNRRIEPVIKAFITPTVEVDQEVRDMIADEWSTPPKAIEVLKVIDECVHHQLASAYAVKCLGIIYDLVLEHEGKTHEDVVKDATWREPEARK